MTWGARWIVLALVVAPVLAGAILPAPTRATTYYVSADSGSDGNTGTTTGAPFQTLDHVNGLNLQPGDQVRLFCGETWRTDRLYVTDSGTAGNRITYTSQPLGCADQPTLSGAWPIAGWSSAGSNLWVADLDAGANAGRFPNGIDQLFRGAERLTLGRWPNLNGGDAGDGYSVIDGDTGGTITDTALPAGDWSGAALHAKGIRWYILNRDVTSDGGSTLGLNQALVCFTGNCVGWGYFLNGHPLTLDREGEWFWDEATNRVTLYSTTAPADGELEGSAILSSQSGIHDGAIVIGRHLQEEVGWVTIDNLRIERWHDSGITFPENLETSENHDLVIRNTTIVDIDGTGMRFATWVWNAGALSGWRGGTGLLVEDNTVERAAHFGIDAYSIQSTFRGNTIRQIGRVEDLGESGLGCGTTGTNCTENGDGFRLQRSTARNAHDVIIEQNTFEDIGMNGVDVFGPNNTVEENVFRRICITKGDCGAIRTFGSGSLASTTVHDVVLRRNVIDTVEGNTDGCHPTFQPLLGIALYVDNYSRDITVDANTVTGSSWVGLLFQHATGTATDNVLYGNVVTRWGSQLDLRFDDTSVALSGNRLVSLGGDRYTLSLPDAGLVSSSNGNTFWSPFYANHIRLDTHGGLDLAGWQAATGFDGGSTEHDYTQTEPEAPVTTLLINDTATTAGLDPGAGAWQDLDGNPVVPPVSVAAFSSRVLVQVDDVIFADGFESGDVSRWSSSTPP